MIYEYEKLKKKYGNFELPAASVTVEGKAFEKNKAGMIIGEVSVELTCGFEASQAVFKIYNCTEPVSGQFRFPELKPFISLGSYISIAMGYLGEREEVFRGFIAKAVFGSGEMEYVEVWGMDIKGIMMASAYAKQLCSTNYGDAVKEIFAKQVYQELGTKGMAESIKVSETPDKRSKEEAGFETIEMTSETDYEFVVKAAKKCNFEFYVDLGTVWFRKAKQEKAPLVSLGMDKGMLEFEVTYDIRGIVEQVEARSMDHGRGELVSAKKKVKNKLSFGNKVKPVVSGSSKVYVDTTIRTKDEAGARAEALQEEIAYRFGSLSLECVGLPMLKPGYFMKFHGFGPPADNRFYVTKVRHELTQEKGYRSILSGAAASVEEG